MAASRNVWAEAVPCPRCRAERLRSCVDDRGARRAPHRERVVDARDAGHAPRRGRPRVLEGGELRQRSVRLDAPSVEAIELYRELHPELSASEADVIRAILAEWLEARRG